MLQKKLDNARKMRKGDAGDMSEYNDSGDSDAWSDSGDSSEYDDPRDSDAWGDSDSSDYGEPKRKKRMIDDRCYRRGRGEQVKGQKGNIHVDDNFSDYDSPSDSDDSDRRANKPKRRQRLHGST